MPHKDPDTARQYFRAYYLKHRDEYIRRSLLRHAHYMTTATAREHSAAHLQQLDQWRAERLRKATECLRHSLPLSTTATAEAVRKYQRTAHGRETRRRYEQRPEVKARRARYRQSARGKSLAVLRSLRYAATAKSRASIARKHATRRSRRVHAHPLTLDQWQDILKHHHHRCVYCGTTERLEQDHVIPLSRGGTHTKANVVPSCRSCNARKGSRLLR